MVSLGAAVFLEVAGGDESRAAELSAIVGFNFHSAIFNRDSVIIAGTPGEIADALSAAVSKMTRDALLDLMNRMAGEVPLAEVVDLSVWPKTS